MLSIYTCITNQHNLWLVSVAALICTLGSWATIRLYRRGRMTNGAEAIGWQFLTATAAGSSVWCTHFIAMLAFESGAPVSFDPVLTIISLLVAMVGAFGGFLIAGQLPGRAGPLVGGAFVGLAVAAMHYTGMRAYLVQAYIEWDLQLLAVSIALAMTLCAASLHVASIDFTIRTKLAAVALLVLGVVSLHFTGMTAFRITPIMIGSEYANPMAMKAMALAVALVGVIIVSAVLASYLIDSKIRERSLLELRHMALTDPLTGLANRAQYSDILDLQMRQSLKTGKSFALVTIDLDRFKEINDLRGHATGDMTLGVIADRMRQFNDGTHFLARIGGDEFAMIVPSEDRKILAARLGILHAALTRPFMAGPYELSVGASIGVCVFPGDADRRETLINNTDLALYRGKASHSDKICFYDSDMDDQVRDRRKLATDLRMAIEHDELELHYQVQTSVSDGRITGYEALLRWTHPELGRIPPSDFIPLAEENGLILQLGEWALRTACRQCASLEGSLKVAVNLSPVQFLHPNLAGLVRDVLAETGMRAENLELELTESAIITDKDRTLAILQQIRALGVTLALDDFGTGYSSLETLRAFPFDKIKLDRSFMIEVDKSQQARSIIRAVLALGRSLEIPVLAEGIETHAQLDILKAEGCDTVQGYLLGRPAPFDNIGAGTIALSAIIKEMRAGDDVSSAAA